MGLKDWLVPQDKLFFDLFEEQAETVNKAANHLYYMVQNFDDVKNKCHKMKTYEHKGDDITHSIYQLLNRSFITPIEPEEISRLASGLDDIIDHIDDTARQMYFYDLDETDEYMIELTRLILAQSEELQKAIYGIRDLKHPKVIEEHCIEINRLENLADDVLGHAIQELFTTDDALRIIKRKDIYETLEIATDKCEEVANVLGDIAIRHS
ncbi:DUF47 family protein [Methanoplanus sp. FWC-SCC4]|uniref:DUF47 family protein n=1 Tax=Methanochimaera problematica TaxID=2609417 RepID=A0AA97I2N1_9EURY|nr:DUF47 family protein [Methanoplanus sp. FWC-SCC4]WOF16455.1 DUF47 family protein [Methanoplanus sp. FWC-SCC4]